jgi:hypothetical protein
MFGAIEVHCSGVNHFEVSKCGGKRFILSDFFRIKTAIQKKEAHFW